MASKSKIDWTEASWNIVTGCTKVSPGCANCYAARNASTRLKHTAMYKDLAVDGEWTGEVRFNHDKLPDPTRWGKPRKIFVASTGDLFHPKVKDSWLDLIFLNIAATKKHIFQVLTKRPERMLEYMTSFETKRIVSQAERPWPLPNLWLGITAENQKTYDERIKFLKKTPAAIRFISMEPLLSGIKLYRENPSCKEFRETAGIDAHKHIPMTDRPLDSLVFSKDIHWVIVGGESGHKARPMDIQWARDIKDQCKEASIPFFFKQLSQADNSQFKDFDNFPEDLKIREYPEHVLEASAEPSK